MHRHFEGLALIRRAGTFEMALLMPRTRIDCVASHVRGEKMHRVANGKFLGGAVKCAGCGCARLQTA